MASSGVRGPTPRWGPTLGSAALFLLLLPAAVAQGEGGRGAQGQGVEGTGRGEDRGSRVGVKECGGQGVAAARGGCSRPARFSGTAGGHPSVRWWPGPALCPGSAFGVVRDRGGGLAESAVPSLMSPLPWERAVECGPGVRSRAGELA